MTPDLSHQTLRERILDAHRRIRAADIGQFGAAFLGKPKNATQRKAARQRLLPVIKSLVDEGQIECHSTVRPFISPNDIALADEPFVRWSPDEPDPRFHIFTLDFHFWNGEYLPPEFGVGKKFTKPGCFTRQIGSPNVRVREINYPWVNIYTTSASTIRTLYSRESPVPGYLQFPRMHRTPLELFMVSQATALPQSDPLLEAELYVDHQLMVTAIYLQILRRSPESAASWTPVGLLDIPQNLGKIPDALVAQAGGPDLAIGYAGPLADLAAIHRFCKHRSMPYELWGHRRTEAWYNPCCQIAYIQALRNYVFSALGPLKCAPALAAIKTDNREKK
ncbi:MAG: hypothetical protein ABSG68_13870 [Thermoguttaceae bacterium]|jgi:hypothetical protein